jgi:hypothetical protein
MQVTAYLRVCVSRTLAALRAVSPGSIAGLGDEDARAYALRFLREYVAPQWHETLLSSYGIDASDFGGCDVGLPFFMRARWHLPRRPCMVHAAHAHAGATANKF